MPNVRDECDCQRNLKARIHKNVEFCLSRLLFGLWQLIIFLNNIRLFSRQILLQAAPAHFDSKLCVLLLPDSVKVLQLDKAALSYRLEATEDSRIYQAGLKNLKWQHSQP
jgi:hypothetical protein